MRVTWRLVDEYLTQDTACCNIEDQELVQDAANNWPVRGIQENAAFLGKPKREPADESHLEAGG
jgi:hypothetical protein